MRRSPVLFRLVLVLALVPPFAFFPRGARAGETAGAAVEALPTREALDRLRVDVAAALVIASLGQGSACDLSPEAESIPEPRRERCLRAIEQVREIVAAAGFEEKGLASGWIGEIVVEIRDAGSPARVREAWERLVGGLRLLEEEIHRAAAMAGSEAPSRVDEGRKRLGEILTRREFAQADSRGSIAEILNALVLKLWKWLRALIARLLPSSLVEGINFWARLLAGACLLLGLLAAALWLMRRSQRKAALERGEVSRLSALSPVLGAGRRTADDLSNEAAACEASGRFREALRLRYLACLVRLASSGVLGAENERFRTNWEIVDHVSRLAPSGFPVSILGELTARFDAVWYGGAGCDGGEASRFRDLAARLVVVPRPPSSHPAGRSRSSARPHTGS